MKKKVIYGIKKKFDVSFPCVSSYPIRVHALKKSVFLTYVKRVHKKRNKRDDDKKRKYYNYVPDESYHRFICMWACVCVCVSSSHKYKYKEKKING